MLVTQVIKTIQNEIDSRDVLVAVFCRALRFRDEDVAAMKSNTQSISLHGVNESWDIMKRRGKPRRFIQHVDLTAM